MTKLFKAIRHADLEEIKRIIEKKPEAVNSVAGTTPKKDHGQSPLQVALKTGHIEIADYLIDHGADVNFCEEEDDDPGLRVPVIFDAITATIDSLCYREFDISDQALILLEKLIDKGANVNAFTSHGLGTINWAILRAQNIMAYPDLYVNVQKEVRNKLAGVLDLLIKNDVDVDAWAERGYYPEPHPEPASRVLLLEEEDPKSGLNYEKVKALREFLRNYFENSDFHKMRG
ncbi:MAG: ankyrin repeat domain-containing protein [Lachnospiraceae bacterium]|nr:ankyrin repeat domain-containing protein [Lachnospiraceae bacterium]